MEPWLLVGGGLCLTLLVGSVAYLGSPLHVFILILALMAGSLILFKPELGLLSMLALIMFKPGFTQGAGLVTMLLLALTGVLAVTIAVRKQLWFLRVHQVQILLLIGLVVAVNWLFVGRIEAPSYLSKGDLTGRVIERTIFHLAFLIVFVSFIRTPRQLLMVTTLFLAAIFLTIPGAVLHSASAVQAAMGKVDKIRAAATIGLEVAENANYLAFIAVMGISLIWFGLLEYRSKVLRMIGGLVILPLVLTVFLSGSRTGLLMLMILPLLLLFQSGLKRGQIVAFILFLVLSVSLSLIFVPERILQRITSLSLESESAQVSGSMGSLQRRLLMIQLGLKLFGESPFIGMGIGNARWLTALDPRSGGIPMTFHDSYLLTLAEGGVILLGAYLLLFWVTLRDLGKSLKLSVLAPEIRLRWLVLATRTNLILLLVFSIFAETWKEFYYLLIFATAAVLSQLYQKAAEQSWIRSRSSM